MLCYFILLVKKPLVVKCFNQQEGINYGDTFHLVVKPCTIRIVLSIALSKNWLIHQLDVQNDFLHGILEEFYTKQPSGFMGPQYPTHVYCLHGS